MAASAHRWREHSPARWRRRSEHSRSRAPTASATRCGVSETSGPIATLRWNAGVHNYMTYITGDIPVGAYDSARLSNHRHRARRDRRRRRLHLFQSADRARILRRARLHLQFREPVDPVSERRRHAFRLGRVAVPDQAVSDRSWWATSTRRSAATAAPATGSAASNRRWSASGRSSASSFRSATCRAISI